MESSLAVENSNGVNACVPSIRGKLQAPASP